MKNDYVYLKLANMRKEQEFVVMQQGKDKFIIQSDKSIGIFNLLDGEGKLNTKGCYFPHLTFALPYQLTIPQLLECKKALIVDGDVIGYCGSSPVIFTNVTEF